MGNEQDPTGMVEQAHAVGQWARSEIYKQGLDNTSESFDYLIQDWRQRQGLSEHTNKQVLLSKLYASLNHKPKASDNRSKLKEIAVNLKEQFEASKERSRAIYKAREREMQEQLAEARRIIRAKDRALKKK